MNNKIKNILESAANKLLSCTEDKNQALQEAWWLIEYVTKQKKSVLLLSNYTLNPQEIDLLGKALQERTEDNKPLQYIIGNVPFLDSTIKVEPPILIPRPETEEWTYWLIEQIKKENMHNQPLKILDLCTGSGCIALGLAQALPQSEIIASDDNIDAVILANENIKLNGCSNLTCMQSDLFGSLYNLKSMFDIIVSNPPYISKNDWYNLDSSVKDWEDAKALWAADEGLALYKKIIKQAHEYLNPKSILIGTNVPRLVLEIGHTQAQEITALLEKEGYNNILTHQDLEGKDRWVSTAGLSV